MTSTWLALLLVLASFSFSNGSPTVLNNGSQWETGTIGDMIWQSSGSLVQGCSVSSISNCYQMQLSSNASAELDPNHLDSPRQRDEFHFPQQSAAESFAYTWKHYLDPSTGSGTTFFHLMQAFGVVEGSPLVTLSVAKGNVVIKDYVRGTGGPQCGTIACPNIPMSQYTGLTTSHSISGAFGPAGSLSYTVKDENGRTLISYSVNGSMGAGGGYVKFGIYRQTFVGMTAALAAVGDWVE
ncbi:hypothetical protein B0H10DRAFT_2210276 [Mycena sp. CBHHK59/15]|nr:hypothetical protein B0H10DRAFT_2210276 [Mycena sp. CBHHK59/15]